QALQRQRLQRARLAQILDHDMRRVVAILEALDHLPLREAMLRQELAALEQHGADLQALDRILVDLHFSPVAFWTGQKLEHFCCSIPPDDTVPVASNRSVFCPTLS